MNETSEKDISFPDKGLKRRIVWLLRYHFHVMLFLYVWFGLVICGLLAPDWRVEQLGSSLISKGWHLSVLSTLIVLPWPVIYFIRFRRQTGLPDETEENKDFKE
ncbi:MAG TPA: hypothetical protein VIS94_08610 [Desulfomonilia bacterium]